MTRTRTIHNPPPELLRRVRAADLAVNMLRRQSIEPSMAERIVTWAAIGLCAFAVSWFAAALVSGLAQIAGVR